MRTTTRLGVALFVAVATACGSAGSGSTTTYAVVDAEQRIVHIETAGCGFAPDRTGSGIAIGDGLVLTVAHLVARADGIATSVGGRSPVNGVVVAIDLERDLAILRVPAVGLGNVSKASLGEGDTGRIVGAARSGTVPFEVSRVVRLTTEEILGNEMHRRLGYELLAPTATGDSGAGAYDSEDRLIGIVFATESDGQTTWITASSEIEDFLSAQPEGAEPLLCDPEQSRLALG